MCQGKDVWLVIVTLDLDNGNQSFVRDTSSFFGLTFYDVLLDLLQPFLVIVDTLSSRYKPMTYDCDLDLGFWNLNFVLDTPFHYVFSHCMKFN